MSRVDAVVIGAGLAGLAAGCQLAQAKRKVLVVASGLGALLLASGCIDLLGFQPAGSTEPVKDPLASLEPFLAERPDHPYRVIGRENIETGLAAFQKMVNNDAVDYRGVPNRNWLLPSAAGAVRPTCLAPLSLANGELTRGGRLLIVGFRELRDFYPALISQNLNAQTLSASADPLMLELPPIPVADEKNVTPIELALTLEKVDFRRQVIEALKPKTRNYDRIGFPAVLGIGRHAEVLADFEKRLGKTVFEISTLPPSAPGRRLYERLRQIFVQAEGQLIVGSQVVDGTIESGRVTQIRFETVNRLKAVRADHFILATGGIYGGGIQTGADGGEGKVWEPVFDLPVEADSNRHLWFASRFLEPQGQPFADFGVKVNDKLNPIDSSGSPVADNLYVAGGTIAGADWTRGRTGEGLALASSMMIVKQILG